MVKKVIGLVATFIVAVALILVGIFFDQWILKTHDDVFETEYSYNETHHWKACILPDCKSQEDYAEHIDEDANGICDVCLYGSTLLIGDVNYTTLQEAVDSATEQTTIKLFDDLTSAGLVVNGQDIILDLNGKTFTPNEAVGSSGTKTIGFQLLKGSKVTIKNGTIKAGEEGIKMLIQNYADLTLEDVVLDGRGLIGAGSNQTGANYVLSNNCGNIVIKGNTTIIADEGDFAFDAYYYAPYYTEGVTVSFADFTGSIQGKVQVDGNFEGAVGQAKIVKPDGTELTENGIYEI